MQVDETVSGDNAEALVAAMQRRAAQEAGFLIGAAIRAMPPLKFAQEVTRRYNATLKDNAPIPTSCEQFIQTGVDRGFATILADTTA
jgi:hypothetical protein